jgi:hypothetical protein
VKRTRYTAHTTRGLVDSASPLGARWVFDDACEDAFARTVNVAQASLFRPSDLLRPDGGGKVGNALWGEGHSPSLVWHAQAIGCLLELGYLPTAESIAEHLEILKWRLGDDCCHDPADHPSGDPWLLRTRHVAWVVACLAELPRLEIDPHEDEQLRAKLQRGMNLHGSVIELALEYLLGRGDAESPGSWTGFDYDQRVWREFWGSDEANALNTSYSMVALCRAERHGYVAPDGKREDTPPLAYDLLDTLFEEIVVDTDNGRPEVYWEHDWTEPWATADLPDGIVALLALALLEYAGLLRTATRAQSPEEEHGIAMRDKARRLAQVLVFRGLDRSKEANQGSRWVSSVDAFIRERDEGVLAEGEWFLPSFSLGVRAVLETGVVGPHHKVVRDAFATIDGMRYDKPLRSGGTVATWFDPTRPVSVRTRARSASKDTWHAKVDITPVLAGEPGHLTRPPVTAAGVHAAAMAWGALRRAAAQVHPPELLEPTNTTGRAASFFRSIDIEPVAERYRLRLRSEGGYEEVTHMSPEWCYVLLALADGTATEGEVRKKIKSLADRAGHVRRTKKPSGLENAVKGINRKFGVDLITWETRNGKATYTLAVTVRLRPERPSRHG